MKNEIMQRLNIVLNALNSLYVSGKTNLANLSGSIAMIEEVQNIVAGINFVEKEETEPKES